MNTSSDWQQLDQALAEVLELDEVAREARLASLEPEFAKRLRRLLNSLDRSVSLDTMAQSPLCQQAFASVLELAPGQQLGAWTVLRLIGSGGMSEVYEAQRFLGEVRQHAALKLMSLGMGGREQRRRFQQETAILAQLDHPRLSRLIDAGHAPDGRPWLAMEYVAGLPITQGCDQRRMSLAGRVQLVIQIAEVLDHAHRQLVIHRDLKPANILLDADGQPRLLDFGIAKVLQPAANGVAGEQTQDPARAYTLHYASPEQLSGDYTGVASDVHQLGQLLYLLMTGSRPFAGADAQPSTLLAAQRAGAMPPSRRLAQASTEIAALRSSSLLRLQRELSGDLDSIVLHALAFAPAQRYPGARALADDLQRWLDHKPVLARALPRWVRASRWLRRHWIGAASVVVLIMLVTTYVLTLAWQRSLLQAERKRTERVLDTLTEMFSVADPYLPEAATITVAEVVDRTTRQLLRQHDPDPQFQSELLARLARLQRSQRNHQLEARLLEHALQLVQLDGSPASPQLVIELVAARFQQGEYSSARAALDQNSAVFAGSAAVEAEQWRASIEIETGQLEAAGERLQALVKQLQATDAPALRRGVYNVLGVLHARQGDAEGAIKAYRLALAELRGQTPAEQAERQTLQSNLAIAYGRAGRFKESDAAFRQLLREAENQLGADHPLLATAMRNYTTLLLRTTRFQTALSLLQHYQPAAARAGASTRADFQLALSQAELYNGNGAGALAAALDSVEAQLAVPADDRQRMAWSLDWLAWVLFELDLVEQAIMVARAVDFDQAGLSRTPLVLLLGQAELPDALRERAQAQLAQPCLALELAMLQAALSGLADSSQPLIPADCHGAAAARLQALGGLWLPPWRADFTAESFVSPLLNRLAGRPLAALVPRLSARLQAVLERLAPARLD